MLQGISGASEQGSRDAGGAEEQGCRDAGVAGARQLRHGHFGRVFRLSTELSLLIGMDFI